MILFDDSVRWGLMPLTFTRPCADLRVGICTMREKWQLALSEAAQILTAPYLSPKYTPVPLPTSSGTLYINATVLPTPDLARQIALLDIGEALCDKQTAVAWRISGDNPPYTYQQITNPDLATHIQQQYRCQTPANYRQLRHWYDLFLCNELALRLDFAALTHGRESQPLSSSNTLIGNPSHIFLEAGAQVEAAILNTSAAPIYVGKNAEIMEGCMVRGGLALGEGACLKMGTKIYGATTIGQYSKVGGEINNSVIIGYSNKAHDGFMGNSVLGEWCNWGADSNNSNLKNNYGEVSVWNYATRNYQNTNLQFCGMVMGDHSKCGINTMFNTGTTIGVCANVFGSGFPPKHIPSFAWGGAEQLDAYHFEKAIETARRVTERRHIDLSNADCDVLRYVQQQDPLNP